MNTYNNREKALQWWNNKTFEEKWYTIVENKKHIVDYPHTNPDRLTGREIEILFKQGKS